MAYIKKGTNNRAAVIMGQKFGRLTIVEDLGSVQHGKTKRVKVKAICDCGKEYEGIYSTIKNGGINSCGCLRREMAREWGRERRFMHGLSKHPLMKIWANMIDRCHNINNKFYHNYGARGVSVCEGWRSDFKSFYDWCISNGWSKGLEIDKDKKGDGLLYSPDTCSIITKNENNRSKRTNINITYNGVTKCLADWAAEYKINFGTLKSRLSRNWTIEQALNAPKITKYAERIKTC